MSNHYEQDELSPEQRKQLRDVLNYALKADPDSLLRAIAEAVMKMNPPIDDDVIQDDGGV